MAAGGASRTSAFAIIVRWPSRRRARRTSIMSSGMRAWKVAQLCGIVYHSTANRRPRAPRLGWPGGCPTALPMACPQHVAPPHPAVLAHVSRGAGRFSCARPARGGAHVGKAVPCGLGGPREAVSGCLWEAAGAELWRGRALGRRGAAHNFPEFSFAGGSPTSSRKP